MAWFLAFVALWAGLLVLVTIGYLRVGTVWWRDRHFGPVMWTTGIPLLGLIAAAAAYLLSRMVG